MAKMARAGTNKKFQFNFMVMISSQNYNSKGIVRKVGLLEGAVLQYFNRPLQ